MKTMMNLMSALVCLQLSSGAWAACDTSQVVEVEIKNMAFNPQHVEICAGQTIRWTNTETVRRTHTVTADPARARDAAHVVLPEGAEPFHSGPIAQGESFSRDFTVAGDYNYFCQPHEMMGHLGSITVVPAE